MTKNELGKLIEHLHRVVLLPDGGDLTDGQLLDCFIEEHDENAFAALVRRHGDLVMGVCRRVLTNAQDAEDAFQGTFLVLVRKADTIIPREMVGNWLYGVAFQTARKARFPAARRAVRESKCRKCPNRPLHQARPGQT